MLTDEEVRAILAVAMGYDNRRPGELNVAAWSEASSRGRWTLGEAIEAVHEHYTNKRDFLMPADVTDFIRSKRRHEPYPGELQIEMAPPADVERVKAVVAEVADALAWPKPKTARADAERDVACPHEPCRAGIGRPCGRRVVRPGVHQGEWREIDGYHDSRSQAARRDGAP